MLLEMHQEKSSFLVIAGRISSEVREKMRSLGINYLDSAGNAFIDKENLFVLIDGKKGKLKLERKHLFTNASIQLLFHFLLNPELLQQTYRDISKSTGASLDNISKTIRNLAEHDYIIASKKKGYVFLNKKKLIERWISEYGERLKPKLFLGEFRFTKEERWKSTQLDTKRTKWGGEPAADIKTGLIRPEIFTLYTSESRKELMQNYRIIPDPKGKIKVYRTFWNTNGINEKKTVPVLLIYADLILSSSARNIDVAKKLLNDQKENIL